MWIQCQANVFGEPTIGDIPSCQKQQYEALSLVLAEYLPEGGLVMDSCNPTNMALLSMAETTESIDDAHHGVLPTGDLKERFSLTCIYFATRGNQWADSSQWLSKGSHCAWYGLTCDGRGQVVGIDLELNKLGGTIPSELAILTHLKRLDIGSGNLEGSIPVELYNTLTNLEALFARSNRLETEISTGVGGLQSLTELDLSYNNIRGALPSEFGLLLDLKFIRCDNCQLAGTLPTEIGECTKLEELSFRTNFIAGIIPTEIGHLTRLQILDLHTNSLGPEPIPTALFRLTQLTYLNMAFNPFEASAFPNEWLPNLTNLLTLDFAAVSFTGTIEPSFWAPSMTSLSLGGNSISGTIPTEIGTLTRLVSLALASNDLEGGLPSELGNLLDLQFLFVMPGNEWLDLGNIPLELDRLITENGVCHWRDDICYTGGTNV